MAPLAVSNSFSLHSSITWFNIKIALQSLFSTRFFCELYPNLDNFLVGRHEISCLPILFLSIFFSAFYTTNFNIKHQLAVYMISNISFISNEWSRSFKCSMLVYNSAILIWKIHHCFMLIHSGSKFNDSILLIKLKGRNVPFNLLRS